MKDNGITGKSKKKESITIDLKQKCREMSCEGCCHSLNWQTLEKRRDFLSLVQCYKIIIVLNDGLPFLDFFKLTKCNRTRANHN